MAAERGGPSRWRVGFVAAAVVAAAFAVRFAMRVDSVPHRRFDEPDAALRQAAQKRASLDPAVDPIAAYARAVARREALDRFASAIGRTLPSGQPEARVWRSGGRAIVLGDRASTIALLDAWTPLGPGNIGGRTRAIRYHPLNPSTIYAAGVSGGVWRSDDSGASWRPTGDGLTNLAVNAL